MKWKKVIPVCLAALLSFSVFSGCAGSGQPGSGTDKESPDATPAQEGLMTPYGRYPELIELHTAKRSSPNPNFAKGDTVDDNAMTRYIQEKLNVKTVTDWEVELSEFPNKLSLMIASDDLPDMFTLARTDYLIYRQLLENDMLEDLSQAYEHCAGEYMKGTFASYEEKNLDAFREGNALYAIAGGNFGYSHNLLWLRKDWMDECGITETPKTLEDVEALLTVFRNKNPGGSYVGMALNAKDIAGGYGVSYSADPIFEVFGATPKTWVKDQKGEVVYGSVMPEMKEGLAVLADWYKKGLIDPQFATRTTAGATDALITGSQTGAAFANWGLSYSISELPKNDPDAELVPVNAPLDAQGRYNAVWPGDFDEFLMVRKGYEYPEAVIKVMNVEYDMWRGFDEKGFELITPNLQSGVSWIYMFPTGGVNLEYADIVPNVGLLVKNYIDEDRLEGAPTATENDKSLAVAAKHYAQTGSLDDNGWIEYHGRYLGSNIVNTPEVNIVRPVFSATTESMADLKPNLDALEQMTFLKIVMGELPVDAFDQFVEDWYAQGGGKITDEVKAMVS